MIRKISVPAFLLIALGGCGGGASPPPAADLAAIQAAVASGQRTPEMRERDADRKPVEVLALSGIKPGDRVIELGSFGQYYSAILSTAVGLDGMLYMLDPTFTEDFGADGGRVFASMRNNAEYGLVDYATADFPSDVDIVFNILFYHDLMGAGIDTIALNAKLFDSLKPGGVYLVVDHKAEDGSGWRDAGTIHRIDAATIVDEVTAAGFELVAESDVLANADDPRTANVFSMRGTTDRAVLVFRKPG
jgi:predicted methyltransferase